MYLGGNLTFTTYLFPFDEAFFFFPLFFCNLKGNNTYMERTIMKVQFMGKFLTEKQAHKHAQSDLSTHTTTANNIYAHAPFSKVG